MPQLVFSIGNGKPVIGIGNIKVQRLFIKMERLEITLFKIKRNTNSKPGISQLGIHLYRFFIKRPCVVHLLQLFVAFTYGTISVGIGLFVFKSMAVNFNSVGIFFQVYQGIAFVKISRCEIVFDQDSVIIGIDSLFIKTKLGKGIAQVIPGSIAVGLVVNVLLIKNHAFLLVVEHIVAKSQLIQGVLVFHVLFQAQLQIGDGGFVIAHVLVNVGNVQQHFIGLLSQVKRFFVILQRLAITFHAFVHVTTDKVDIRVRCFEHSRFFKCRKCLVNFVGND